MKIVIAPDSFKGFFTSVQASDYIEKGIISCLPDTDILKIPLSDGGDGFLDVILQNLTGKKFESEVLDPLERIISAEYAILSDKNTALIEMAKASGLNLLKKDEYKVWDATTFGTGQLIKNALEEGCQQFIIGLGGSATCDGGAGALQALGFDLLDENDRDIESGGGNLGKLLRIENRQIHPALSKSLFKLAVDVDNILIGRNGTAMVYAGQKGADQQVKHQLDKNLTHFAKIIEQQYHKQIQNIPGSGAAGGLAAGLYAFLNAEIIPGIEIILSMVNFNNKIADADYIITGEGKIDLQSLSGKVISGVCQKASSLNIPVIAIGAIVQSPDIIKSKLHLKGIYGIQQDTESSKTPEDSTERLIEIAKKVASDIKRRKI